MKAAGLPPHFWPFPVGGDDAVPDDYEPTDVQLGATPPSDPYDSPSYATLTHPTTKGSIK